MGVVQQRSWSFAQSLITVFHNSCSLSVISGTSGGPDKILLAKHSLVTSDVDNVGVSNSLGRNIALDLTLQVFLILEKNSTSVKEKQDLQAPGLWILTWRF